MNSELEALYLDLYDIIEPGAEWLPSCQKIAETLESRKLAAVGEAVNAALQDTEILMPLVRTYLADWDKMANAYNSRCRAETQRIAERQFIQAGSRYHDMLLVDCSPYSKLMRDEVRARQRASKASD